MSSSSSFIEYISDVLSPLGNIRTKKMFGEYGVYCNEVFFALVCDDVLYFQCDEALLKEFPETGFPYVGASLAGMAGPDLLENQEFLLELAKKSYQYKATKLVKKKKSK